MWTRLFVKFLFLCPIIFLVACSSSSKDTSASIADSSSSSAAESTERDPTVCDSKTLTINDLSGITEQPITGHRHPISPLSCYFTVDHDPRQFIRVLLQPGEGKSRFALYEANLAAVDGHRVGNAGDDAIWLPIADTLLVRKDDLLCDVSAHGHLSKDFLKLAPAERVRKIGNICTKLFLSKI